MYYNHHSVKPRGVASARKSIKNLKEGKVLNKTELVAAIAAKAGISKKDADAALSAFADSIIAEIKKGGKVQIVGFGTFEARKRAARTGINPQTKEQIKIAASTVPAFKAGKAFKDAVK
ncbi:HU family DNA-binding protein [Christensenella massiliensis]|uniref:HU family DNA-binding protein n=1 Tax=Christensenella massiliensis TaxID=1805714 RepID=A0AAU8ABT7_9FIRM